MRHFSSKVPSLIHVSLVFLLIIVDVYLYRGAVIWEYDEDAGAFFLAVFTSLLLLIYNFILLAYLRSFPLAFTALCVYNGLTILVVLYFHFVAAHYLSWASGRDTRGAYKEVTYCRFGCRHKLVVSQITDTANRVKYVCTFLESDVTIKNIEHLTEQQALRACMAEFDPTQEFRARVFYWMRNGA